MSPLRISASLLWSLLVWVALWGDLHTGTLLTGLAVGAGVLWAVPLHHRPRQARVLTVRPLAALRFLGFFIVALARANAVVAWETVTPRNRIHQGILALPVRTRSHLVATVIGNAISLTPGTLTLEIESDPLVLYVHVLHLRDPESVRADLHRLEELAMRAFDPIDPRKGST